MTDKKRAASIVVFTMVALNGLFLFGNGLFMLVAPSPWYYVVPGVTQTGPFNQHFIRDIGLIQMFLGAAFGIGMIRPASRVALWAAATTWLIAHAVLHLWEVAVGICAPSAIARDFPAVTLPALAGIVLTAWAWRSRNLVGNALCGVAAREGEAPAEPGGSLPALAPSSEPRTRSTATAARLTAPAAQRQLATVETYSEDDR